MSKNNKGPDWQKLNEIIVGAMELAATEQKIFLNKVCNGDKDLHREVEAMLAACKLADEQDFLEADAFAAGAKILAGNAVEKSSAGKRIGKYNIIREIGRGGMGSVYLAEHEELHHLVALKIIKRGMDTDAVLMRFVRERQILSELNHPNIARLFDGGSTDDGLPFFAMEYVDGLPVTQYCDKRKLNIEARLELFRKVCAAVAYAHQNLIVHRDIKPSNILVTDDGEVKLLDFGISKILTSDGSDLTETAAEIRMMTPEYASPEQVRGEKITTVSDIYSLGVLLYELLSGHRPFSLKDRSTDEVLKIVCEEEPSAPSTAAVTDQVDAEADTKAGLSPITIAEWRAETQPDRLRRRLTGDLDNIVLMSLRKEPHRRYGTVEQFSEDIRRHLRSLPVIARPATFRYSAAKYLERNRVAASFAAIALIALLTGFSVAIWKVVEARRERTRAERRFDEVRKLSNLLMTDFYDEIRDLPGSYPVRLKLAKTSSDHLRGLALDAYDPELMKELAKAHFSLYETYSNQLDDSVEARFHLQIASDLAHRLADLAPDDLRAKGLVADTTVTWGRERAEWEQIAIERLRLREEIAASDPPDIHRALADLADAYWFVGDTLGELERRSEAATYYRRAVEAYNRQIDLLGEQDLTANEYNFKFYANVWAGMIEGSRMNDWTTGLVTSLKALAIAEEAAILFPDDRRSQTNLHMAHSRVALAFANTGDDRRALEHYREAVRRNKETGIRYNSFWHPTDVKYRLRIVEILQKQGQTTQALADLRGALEARRKATEIDHANPVNDHAHSTVFFAAGKIFAKAGMFNEALAAYREADEHWQAALPGKYQFRRELGLLYVAVADLYAKRFTGNRRTNKAGEFGEASRWYEKAIVSFNELEAEGLSIANDREVVRAAREGLRSIASN